MTGRIVVSKILVFAATVFLFFTFIIGFTVLYFTGFFEDEEAGMTGDYRVQSSVYTFEDSSVADLLIESRVDEPLRFRSCTLKVPETVMVYTDHAPIEEETRMAAYISKAPAIDYSYTLECSYLKGEEDKQAKVTVEGQITPPERLEMSVEKSEEGISGEVVSPIDEPRIYAAIGASEFYQLIVKPEEEDAYAFSLSGNATQRAVVMAFGVLDQVALYAD